MSRQQTWILVLLAALVMVSLRLSSVAVHGAAIDGSQQERDQHKVKRQAGIVRCFTDRTDTQCDGTAAVVEVDTIATCCQGDGYFYSLQSSTTCEMCIVIGWFNATTQMGIDSFTAPEDPLGYDIRVDYIKGSGLTTTPQFQVRTRNINTTSDTDYFLSTTIVGLGNDARVTLRPDAVALEEDEILQLILMPMSGTTLAENVFLRDTISITIIDIDVVSIFFSEVDYSLAPEDAQNLTAVVVREIAIATPITVFVYPLNNTFANRSRIAPPVIFKGEPLQLSEETLIPPDDIARPTVATSGEDFDDNLIVIEMEPSELSQEDYPFTVKVVADDINEAVQNFVLILRLNSTIRRDSVDTARRNSTRCIIRDDDPIFLSFEFPEYNLEETQFEEFYDDVSVIKSNGLMTEQLLQIWFQIESPNTTFPTATRRIDYIFGTLDSVVRPIFSFQQDIRLLLTVLADSVFEGVESFGIGMSNNINSVPFLFGEFPSTIVNVVERRSITVGFERNFTSVSEGVGSFELCASISTPGITISENVYFSLNLFSVQDSADEADFVEITFSNNPLVNFTSNPSSFRQCFDVNITDDEVLEDTERFSLRLTLNDTSGQRLNIIIDPDMSSVEIVDTDEVTVGFERNFTSVSESVGSFELCVRIFTEVELFNISFGFNLNLSSTPITADGTADYLEFTPSNNPLVAFTSDPSTHRQCFNANITDDLVLEGTERFLLSLVLAEGSTIPVNISPNISHVDITDDDFAKVGFEQGFISVDESAGSFPWCVRLFTDASLLPTSTEFSLDLFSVASSADANDYAEFTLSNNPLVAFTSDPSTHRQCFNVTITDDLVLEDTERFNLTLTLAAANIDVVVSRDISEVEIIDDDFILVGFETDLLSVNESAGSVELCVRIFTNPTLFPNHTEINFFLDLISTTGSANSLDFGQITDSNNPLVAFTSDPSTHRQCFEVDITDDLILEDTENFFLNLTLSANYTIPVVVFPDSAQVNIIDDDVIIVGFERNFTSIDESVGSFELCVGVFTEARFLPAMFEFSLNLVTVTNTADAGDFQEIVAPNNLLVPFTQDPSTHRQCFFVNITDDEFLEETERFDLALSLIEGPTVPVEVQPPISEVEIIDDDFILVGFERNFSIVIEVDGSFELCVSIFTNPIFFPSHVSIDFSLNLMSLSGTADANDYGEFTSSNNPLVAFTSDPSTHRQCFSVNITNDLILEDTERFSLTLTLADGSNVPVVVDPDVSEVEIIDTDFLVVGFKSVFSRIDEDMVSHELCVRIFTDAALLPIHTNFSFSLGLITVPGTANSSDYDEFTSSNNPLVAFTSDPSTHRQCFNVTIIDDDAVETSERFNLSLTLADGFNIPVIVDPDTSEVEIIDNDNILVGFERNFTSVNESVGSFELCVEIFTDPSLLPENFEFSLNLITVPGTAGTSDFGQITDSNNPLVAFTSDPSTHRQCFEVDITDDAVLEDTEGFSLNLSLAEEPTFPVLIIPDSSEVEIEDQNFITVGFEEIFTSIDEDSGSFELCVAILTDRALLPTHTVFSFSLDLLSLPGTADSSDYLEFTSSNNPLVAFTSDPSTHRQCFNVTITDDLVLEDTERFSLTLTLADGSNVPVVVDPDVSEVEIIDDDVIFVGFVETFTPVNETVGAFELCVAIFTNASLLPDSFQFSLNLITIPGTAAPSDYDEFTSSNNPLVAFTSDPSTHRQCFNVNITDDLILEDTERFNLRLSLADGATIPVEVIPDSSEVEIQDEDVITVGFEEIFTSIGEGSGSFELCVAILTDRALLPTHTVFSFSLDLLSLSGTADSSDYLEFTSSNNPLVAFTSDPSSHRQCFNVTITDDLVLEDTERFSLTLTLADGSNVPVVVDPDVSEVEIVDDDRLIVGFETDSEFTSVNESIGSFELCVRIFTDATLLPTHMNFSFSLDLITVAGTADGTSDYLEFTSSNNPLVAFTSDPSTHRQCFNVTITDDLVLEDTERFSLTLTLADGSNVPVVVDPDISEVEIIDDDVIFVGFVETFTPVIETVGAFELCVAIFTNASLLPDSFQFSLNLITISGTAGPSDYLEFTSSNNPLVAFTSDPSTHRQCFNVNITDDLVLEDTERFNLRLSLADGATIPVEVIPDSSEVEIQDEDVITVGFEEIFTSIDEGSGSFELCVAILTDRALLPTHTGFSFSLDLLSLSGTADSSDYDEFVSSNNPLVAFTSDPSTHRQCFNVTITDDLALEDTERFSLTLTLADGSNVPVVVDPDVSEVEIIDNDVIFVGFVETFTPVNETVGAFELCVAIFTNASLLPDSFQFSLNLITIPDTAGPSDYLEFTPSNDPLVAFTSDPSTHRQCFDVNITDDLILEDTERFNLRLSLADGATVPVEVIPDSSEVEIQDEDVITVGFEEIFTSVGEGSGSFELCVAILTDRALLPTYTVFSFSLDLLSLPGTADSSDYNEFTSSNNPLVAFTSSPSTHRQCFNVTIIDDLVLEDTERFSLTLTLADGSNVPVVMDPDVSEVEIVDDDRLIVGFETDSEFTSVNERIGSFELCVRIFTDATLLPTHMNFSFSLDLISVPGTADGTSDYLEFTSSNNPLVAFTSDPSTHRQCFNVNITDDLALEDTERFSLTLTLADGSNVPVVVDPDVSEVEIIDDDVIFVGFVETFTPVIETVGAFELCVAIFTNASLLPDSFQFSLNLITISGTAGPSDYLEFTSSNNPLVAFTSDPSTHRQCFNVNITDDLVLEDTERFNLRLSLANGATVPVEVIPDLSEVEIQDEDVISVGFEEIFTSIDEGSGSFELCVAILTDRALLPTHTVFSFSLDLLSLPGTADSSDYDEFTSSNNPLVAFTSDPSTHRQCFNVTITDDLVLEDTERFSLTLTLADGSNVPVVVDPDVSEVEIIDDDGILVGFETILASAYEGNDTVELCVRIFTEAALLPTHINMSFSLDLISVPGTADTEDYDGIDASNNPLVAFTSDPSTHRQCFEVNITDDLALEDTEDFSLQLSLAQGGSNVPVSIDPEESTVEIIDDDYVVIGFELSAVIGEESVGVVTLVVSVLDGGTTTPITVDFTTQNGTAMSPLDFTSTEQLLFFNETVVSHDIEVLIINDGIPELSEYFLAILSLLDPLLPPSKILISPAVANITIVDGSPIDQVNDTVIGDPLLTVPLLISNLDDLNVDQNVSLCYEVHGQSDKYFNFVSDICTSVSAHYLGVASFNVIDEIGVRAIDNSRNCRNILVSKEGGGTVTVDGEVVTRFSEGGISVRKYQHHVRIAVPNCAHADLVMWVICQNRTLTDYNDQGDAIRVSVTMMKFVIARGFNLQQSSHGILGQFWNVPIIAEPYNGTVLDVAPGSNLNYYTVTVSHPDSPVRQFAAFLWPRSWEIVRGEYQPCLYAGSHQAGRTDEIEGYSDPVIEGLYTDYIVSGPFDTEFEYSRFEQRRCR